MDEKLSQYKQLITALLTAHTAEEMGQLLDDMCTPAELTAMNDRIKVLLLLGQQQTYRQINETTGVSTTTITRVARALTYGSGGYKLILEKQNMGSNK